MGKQAARDWVEFFQDTGGAYSMTRLLCFMSWFPASYVVMTNPTSDLLGWYLGSFVLGYVGGKAADVFMRKPATPQLEANDAATSPNSLAPVGPQG